MEVGTNKLWGVSMRGEENSLRLYVRNSWDVLVQGVRVTGEIKSDETVSKNEFKRHIEKMNWDSTVKRKRLNGQFLRGIPGTTHVRLRNLELDTESRLEDPNRSTYLTYLCSPGTGQALRTNYIMTRRGIPLYVGYMVRIRAESVSHIACECKKLDQREFKQRHDTIAKVVISWSYEIMNIWKSYMWNAEWRII